MRISPGNQTNRATDGCIEEILPAPGGQVVAPVLLTQGANLSPGLGLEPAAIARIPAAAQMEPGPLYCAVCARELPESDLREVRGGGLLLCSYCRAEAESCGCGDAD